MKLRQLVIAALALGSAGAIAAANDTSANPSPSSSQSYTSSLGNNSQVSQIQQALNDKGFNAGAVDGQMGPKTKSALKQFQQAQGLQASGQLDQQTLAALTTGSSSSSQATQGSTSSSDSIGANSPSSFSPQSSSTASGTNGATTTNGTNGASSSSTPAPQPAR